MLDKYVQHLIHTITVTQLPRGIERDHLTSINIALSAIHRNIWKYLEIRTIDFNQEKYNTSCRHCSRNAKQSDWRDSTITSEKRQRNKPTNAYHFLMI